MKLPAGEIYYEDIGVGDYFDTGGVTVTEAHILGFAGVAG